jgi:nicotinamidase-related amidase
VDVQNDFISGSLRLDNCPAKENAEEVVPIINQLIQDGSFDTLAYTYDWHPADHCSYLSNIKHHGASVHSSVNIEKLNLFDVVTLTKPVELKQVMWPDHCVQNSWGAELHNDLRVRYCTSPFFIVH